MNLSEIDFTPFEGFCSYLPNPIFKTLMKIRNKFVVCCSGNRGGKCITFQTLIETPKGEIPMGELYKSGKPFEVYSWDGNKKVVAQAMAPFKKEGLHQCYRIEMSDGRWIEAADHHLILTNGGGYFPVSLLQAFFASLRGSTLEPYPSTHALSVPSYEGRSLGCQDRYFSDYDLCDGKPHLFQGIGQSSVPLRDDVREHIFALGTLDDLGNKHTNNPCEVYGHLSNRDVHHRTLVQFFEFLVQVLRTNVQRLTYGLQEFLQPLFGLAFGLQSFSSVDQFCSESSMGPFLFPFLVDGNYVQHITTISGKQEVFDMTVPGLENYCAGGLIHHNTRVITRKIVYQLMNQSPIESHNFRPGDKCRTMRLSCALLPQDKDNEHQCTLYIELKKQLPSTMIRGDITYRRPVLTVQPTMSVKKDGTPWDLWKDKDEDKFKNGAAGKVGILEFVSYGQEIINKAGVERRTVIWDEPGSYSDYEEDVPRIATVPGAQFVAGFTPVEADWMYGELYQKAKYIVRTPAVRNFMKKEMGITVPEFQQTDSRDDIFALQWATDDNPMFKFIFDQKQEEIKSGKIKRQDFPYGNVTEWIDSTFIFNDIPTIAMRRYGIFTRITGAIHKQYHWDVHRIDERRWFPNGVPIESGIHVRLIDYHQNVPWACLWLWLSPENECFAYEEFNPDPKDWTTLGIAKELVMRSHQGGSEGGGEYKYKFNLIDVPAAIKQGNTNTSVVDDLNTHFRGMKQSGLGTGGYWETWDTHGNVGRDRVKERLINSLTCGRPFNNLQMMDGQMVRLPTLWIFSKCHQTNLSLKNWRQDTWASKDDEMIKDQKDKVETKWSHFNMCLEAAMKDVRFRGHPYEYRSGREDHEVKRYFQGGRR